MGSATYINALWRTKQSDVMRYLLRLRAWEGRQLGRIVRLSSPSRPEKARALGYKAKQGYVIVRIRTRKHGMKRDVRKGKLHRKPRNTGVYVKNDRNAQTIAETRVCREFPNLRILGSYWVAEDGTYKFYETILVDPMHNAVRNDGKMNWVCDGKHSGKADRGLTSSGRKARGLRGKGVKHHKNRPSKDSHKKKKRETSLRKKR
eukprot:GAHX01000079.1.p1 GENE.GAHX01000079.1~~GAHX01000079.1.p1  ORF type:complete len:204 (+),score=21.67 GAHX01000079.1:36-647(+)